MRTDRTPGLPRTLGLSALRHPYLRARRFLAPRALRVVSPLGWVTAAVVLAVLAPGLVFGWREAVVAGIAGVVLLALAVAFVLARSAYRVDLDLARTRVAVGDSAVGAVSVGNTSHRPLLPADLELPVGPTTAVFHLPRLTPDQVHEDLFTIPTNRRTVLVVGPVRSVRADPLGLLRRQFAWTEAQDLFVHPRTVALGSAASGFIRDLEGLSTRDLTDTDVSFHALRTYVPGDDRRHIHWKTTARTGQLMVRQFEETRRSHVGVTLSANAEEYDGGEDFELAVSVAASISLQAIREQRNVDVLTQAGPLRTATARALLDDFTRLESAPLRTDALSLARTAADAVPNASVMFFVVGRHVTARSLSSAASAVAPGIRCFAVRCGAGIGQTRSSLGDLTVLTVDDLTELPLLLRRGTA